MIYKYLKTNIKNLGKIACIALFPSVVLGTTKTQAQTKYGFATFSNQFNSDGCYAHYLVISDPVKNWFSFSKQQHEDFKTNFKTKANKQLGFELIKSYNNPTPYNGNYEKFSSQADCEEKIQDEVCEFRKYFKNSKKPLKIIYANLN